jgi:D-beta-D-heptose 7-phosphate kinase/D-beta-D-heptose 1-phosphate adenosyltransferase
MAQHNSLVFDTASDAARFIEPQRKKGTTIVTTNGCFDLIHPGHVAYLTEAAALGTMLIVGVNCDAVVRTLKGPGRPVFSESDRAHVVAALQMVDAAFVFKEPDPRTFIDILKPDIHVKGGDYSGAIIEKDAVERNGGIVRFVSYLKNYSTSNIVKRIRSHTAFDM